jgi:DNA-binding transcriptional LysR family regulator
MDKLNLLKQFICVVEQGGFAAAANELGQSPSTLSKSIARLEKDLSFKLFYRSTRQVRLTSAGSEYLTTAVNTLRALEQSESQLRQNNNEYRGQLRINLPVSYGRLYVMPLLQKFKQTYPDIDFQLSFNDSYVDMMEKKIDLTIRTGTVTETNLVARKISPIDFLICASKKYVEQHPNIRAETLVDHPWIRFKYQQSGRLMPIVLGNEEPALELDSCQQYIVDDGEALANLCAQGLGLTQLPHFIARDWLESEALQVVMPYYRNSKQGVYAIYPNREYLPAKVQAFVTFLIAQMEASNESAYHTWAEQFNH